ncbi:MAG: hypothetical protein M1828_001722 [Chrysothrix sp. TS-e1954]|nr:MAG: hypothetical protein M1828_001722 [Chrysothrix sp. TS-e1954]
MAAFKWDAVAAKAQGCEPVNGANGKWQFGFGAVLEASRREREGRLLKFFLEVIQANGNTFELKLLFSRAINTIEPRNIEAIFSSQFSSFGVGKRPLTFAPLLGTKGIFTQDDVEWQHSRALLRPQFMSNRMQNFEQVQECVEDLIRCIPEDTAFDLQPLFFRLTFDTTTCLLFGRRFSSWDSKAVTDDSSSFAESFNTGQDYVAWRGHLGPMYWLMDGIKFRRAARRCHRFVDSLVREALESPVAEKKETDASDTKYVFLDALAEETRDPATLRDQCMNILLAGRDTTACLLSWTFRLLVRHPNVLAKLRAEIEEVVGLGSHAPPPTMSDIKRMTYLSLILKETLRLYPSVPANSREAVVRTKLPTGGGKNGTAPVLVQKGQPVGYCVYAMHRRQDIYGIDAHEFRPERWENDALKDIGWGYLPFNGGPRICLGQEFALLEAGYTVARLVQEFAHIHADDPAKAQKVAVGDKKQTLTLVLSSADGCRVRFNR